MNASESLLQTAAGDYKNGNYKDSYSNYLKVASSIIHRLLNEVAFSTPDTVKNKPNNSNRLFQQLTQCVQRAEDILQNRTSNGSLPSPQPSYISDVAPSTHTVNANPAHLPLIPFSPLTRQFMFYMHALTTASNKVVIAKQKSSDGSSSSNNGTPAVRRLTEDVRIQRSKFDAVSIQIQSISQVNLFNWEPESVAKQLTIIDSELYGKVDFKKDLMNKDKKHSRVQACLDFHRYLTNNFTHQFIIYADTPRPTNSPRSAHQNIISHGLKIAYFLLHVHRDFNSFSALMKALTSPEVRRIRRLWSGLSLRTNTIFKDMAMYVNPANDYKAYREVLAQKLDAFREAGPGMVVVPWMQTHYEEVKLITQVYATGNPGESSDVVLSAPGARKLASIFALLEQCQSNTISSDDEDWGVARKASTSSGRVRETITVDGAVIPLPLDLSCLGYGDLGLHHWLVSRVYLTKQQLIDESIEIEPLVEGEPLPCVENDYEEEEDEDDDHISIDRDDLGSFDSGDNAETAISNDISMVDKSLAQKSTPDKSNESSIAGFNGFIKDPPHSSFEGHGEVSKNTPNISSHNQTSERPFTLKPSDEMIKAQNKYSSEPTTPPVLVKPQTANIAINSQPIPIPSALSSSSLPTAPSLNPNAVPFVPRSQPRSQSFSNTDRNFSDTGADLSLFRHDNSTKASGDDDEDDVEKFVYNPDAPDNKSEEDEPFVYKKDGEEYDKDNDAEEEPTFFVYEEHVTPPEEMVDDDDNESSNFVYSESDAKTSAEDANGNGSNEDPKSLVPDTLKSSNKDTMNGIITTIATKEATEVGGADEITVKLNINGTN